MLTREKRSLVDRMAALPLLGDLTREELTSLCRAGRRVTLPDGWVFLHERTPADACYIVLAGEACVRVAGQEVARIGAGELVGEAALVEQGLRTASVTACGPVELLHLDYATLARLLVDRPHLHEALRATHRRHRGER